MKSTTVVHTQQAQETKLYLVIRVNQSALFRGGVVFEVQPNCGIRMILASVMKTISLTQLLSSCMDASRQGCEVSNQTGRLHIRMYVPNHLLSIR